MPDGLLRVLRIFPASAPRVGQHAVLREAERQQPFRVSGEAYRNEVNKVFTMKLPSRLPSQKMANDD
ncbi:hypothetical protein NXT3_CH03335 [Sinorhizobium fredii]|uniref:Uncharacterized protein n=1 Tax=Rhizobium fredii TaxID=380 RepID=A0A2L0H8U1_RHIFR|nr:hypothetical protein NXT3_CH03335 [Sinorhizobium fredii]